MAHRYPAAANTDQPDNRIDAPIDATARYPGCPLPNYQRWRILPRLVRVDDIDLREPVFSFVEPADLAATLAIIERLQLALDRAERRKRARHWSYAATPHEALRLAHTAERWFQGEQEAVLGGRSRVGATMAKASL